MPPQQPDRLLDLFNEAFDFSAHGFSDLRRNAAIWKMLAGGCSRARRKAQSPLISIYGFSSSKMASAPRNKSEGMLASTPR
jgi:phage replication-related protein YjqB (UPF0714/DUF867 family)